MKLIPWHDDGGLDVFRDMERIQNEMNRLFEGSLLRRATPAFSLSGRGWSPAVDVQETRDAVLVKADLPGLSKEDIEVTLEGNVLTIQGEKKEERELKTDTMVRHERFAGSFARAIPLPAEVDAAKAKAAYRNGVLELTLPKTEESKPRQISVEVQ